MRRVAKRQGRAALLRNLLLGLLLGGLHLLLIGSLLSFWLWYFPWWLYVGVGVLSYLLIPAWVGFLTARQTGDANTGVGAGCLVGGVSILVAILAVVIIDAQIPRPPCGGCNNAGFLQALILLFETMGGTILTVLGSSISEAIGLSRFLAHYQSSVSGEKR
ncbi:MAG TPA: hypothetical protein VFU69_01930 [Ktedonobacterales bacterium]|nr:hypothetical protein [Ktedonobacterales bacterium]